MKPNYFHVLLVWSFFLAGGIQVGYSQTVPSPTQTDVIIIDNGASGKADPADRIRYTVTITNTGGANATGMQFTAVPDPRTTFVAGSFRSSPLAVPDSYTSTGNVGINISAAAGLKANDFDDNIPGLTITAGTFTTTQNGSIMISADGSFMYTPPPGFTGTDTYTYTLVDANPVGAPVPATDGGLISITVSNLIWFIDNSSIAATSDGRVTSPFKSLTDFNAGSAAAGDVIYVEHTGTTYTGGIVLQNNERLFGEGHPGTAATGENLSTVLPFALAPNSKPLPNIDGSRPIISNTNAMGDGITLAANNTIIGVNMGDAADQAIDDNGLAGNLTISSLDINNTFGGGVAKNGGGVLNVVIGTVNTNGSTTGIGLANTTGSFSVTGTITMAGYSVAGISLGNATNTFSVGGLTTLNTGNAATNNVGIAISEGNSGTITFANIEINGRRDKGILIATTNRTITLGNVDIDNTLSMVQPAIDITMTTGSTISFGATTISLNGAGGTGINLVNNAATISFASGSSITTGNGTEFVINQGAANVTYNGTITNSGASAVSVTNRTGGTVDFQGNITSSSGTFAGIIVGSNTGGTIIFSGASKAITSTSGNAINLTLNSGATVNFTNGGLVANSTSGIAFNATGGGTINVTGSGNTINATTGPANSNSATALNVTSTTIGASNLNFQSISSGNNSATADPSNGIVLNNTGATGGLIVTGTGTTNASGGTIQNISARGISATTTANLSLKNIVLTNANLADAAPCGASDNSGCNAAIYLNTVTNAVLDNVDISGTVQQGINVRETSGFQLLNSTITNTGAGGQTEEAGLYALNVFGTGAITNTTISFPAERGAVFYNTNKTLTMTVSGSSFNDTQTSALGADGFEFSSFGTSVTDLDITNCSFLRDKTNGVQFITENTAQGTVDISGCTVDPQAGVGAGLEVASNGTSTLKFNIQNNPDVKARLTSVINCFAQGNSTMEGQVHNNTVTSLAGSGSGIRAVASADGDVKIKITNNTVSNIALDNGITAVANSGTGRMDATITGNNVTVLPTAAFNIQVVAGASSSVFTNKTCANVANNTVSPASVGGMPIANFQGRAATPSHELLIQGASPMTNMWNTNGNMPTSPTALVVQTGTGVFTFGATCLLPSYP